MSLVKIPHWTFAVRSVTCVGELLWLILKARLLWSIRMRGNHLFSDLNRSLRIDERSANELLFQKYMVCLTDPLPSIKNKSPPGAWSLGLWCELLVHASLFIRCKVATCAPNCSEVSARTMCSDLIQAMAKIGKITTTRHGFTVPKQLGCQAERTRVARVTSTTQNFRARSPLKLGYWPCQDCGQVRT